MDSNDMKKVPLDEAELEQVDGGTNINQIVIVSPTQPYKAVCSQCTYTKSILPTSTLEYCPNCHLPLIITSSSPNT